MHNSIVKLPYYFTHSSSVLGAPQNDGDNLEGNEVHNGQTGLLYHPLQLHTPMRKAAQAILLQVCLCACLRLMCMYTYIWGIQLILLRVCLFSFLV